MATFGQADTAPISAYLFMGTCTVSGIFVDSNGMQVGDGFSGASNTTSAQRLWQIASLQSHPKNAVGAILNFSADIYYKLDSATPGSLAHFQTNYATMYPKQAGPAYNVAFGKVN
jgi:hypothetical protein